MVTVQSFWGVATIPPWKQSLQPLIYIIEKRPAEIYPAAGLQHRFPAIPNKFQKVDGMIKPVDSPHGIPSRN